MVRCCARPSLRQSREIQLTALPKQSCAGGSAAVGFHAAACVKPAGLTALSRLRSGRSFTEPDL